MPIKIHFWLGVAVPFIAFIAGFFVFINMDTAHMHWALWYVLFPALTLGSAFLAQFVFRALVPARCPKCGYRAYRGRGESVVYVCRSCSHSENTGWTERTSRG